MQYISKQHQLRRTSEQVFTVLSDLSNFSPALEGRVDDWQATADRCSFKAKGFMVALRIEERIPFTTIKIVSDNEGGGPFPFSFWVQLQDVAPGDTRLRLVFDVTLNTMMKMMVGGKLQGVIDGLAEQLAQALNQ